MLSENHKPSVPEEKIRVAVIGLGVGKGHVESVLKSTEGELVAVVDLRRECLEPYQDRLGEAGLFTDHREMLLKMQPDLVALALPNSLHRSFTLDALAAGAHVFCEKPMATSVAGAEEMRDAARAAGLQLGINFSQRFLPASRAFKEIIANGELGEIYHGYCSWMRRYGIPGFGGWFGQKKLSGGGPLIDLGVHRIDLALWLMGHPKVVSVCGAAHHRIGVPRALKMNAAFDVEDFATGFVRFDTGASLTFEVSWESHQRKNDIQQMRILGSAGSIEQDDNRCLHHFHRDAAFCTTEIDVSNMPVRNSLQEMIRCVAKGEPFSATPEQGISVQRILNGLYSSAATGREVTYEE